jgi:hypothetical protein
MFHAGTFLNADCANAADLFNQWLLGSLPGAEHIKNCLRKVMEDCVIKSYEYSHPPRVAWFWVCNVMKKTFDII